MLPISSLDSRRRQQPITGAPPPDRSSSSRKAPTDAQVSISRKWLVVVFSGQTMQEGSFNKEIYVEQLDDDEDHTQELEEDLNHAKTSIRILSSNLDEQNKKKLDLLDELQSIQDRIGKEVSHVAVERLISSMQLLKSLEEKESDFQSQSSAKRVELQDEVKELEEKLANGCDSKTLTDSLDNSLSASLEKLNSAKRELSAKLRAILSIKRQLDEVPSQSELVQYERRFSELYSHIQDKLRQTRKYYATYNALLEIKELMLKEISLLNSIGSQFQDAITTTAGRMKLIDSMEGIVKSSQQKLGKVELRLQDEQKDCKAMKEKHASATRDQRRSYSLLKAFQEECAKNERLKNPSSVRN